ncbi:hypothetical protein GCM10027290_16020 [Micromonospora sonneratiae]|uniref:Uncharacterized protein n=1 Tax=Micromonospora sonneratiae TaxID=1184706 RepID=A0ABW3YQZ3_9ACTN
MPPWRVSAPEAPGSWEGPDPVSTARLGTAQITAMQQAFMLARHVHNDRLIDALNRLPLSGGGLGANPMGCLSS